ASEFERWRTLRTNEAVSGLVFDQIIRSYLLDKDIEALLNALPDTQQSEATAIMLGIMSKLFNRFLTDPANGLNSYLSLRVRHGTLRGVLLGPIEEERLLLSGEYSQEEFEKKWAEVLRLPALKQERLVSHLLDFGRRLDSFVTWIVDERIQILSS